MMSCCGLLCNECPAYLATVNNDDALREKTAIEWSKMYSSNISTTDINCLGCKSEEVVFSYCKICEIRACNKESKLNNCAQCSDFSCEKLEKVLLHVPEARERLSAARGK